MVHINSLQLLYRRCKHKLRDVLCSDVLNVAVLLFICYQYIEGVGYSLLLRSKISEQNCGTEYYA